MMNRANIIGAITGFALTLASVPFWIAYMGHGFAYGAWLRMPGKELHLIETGNLATQTLRRAMAMEGCGLTVAIWSVLSRYHLSRWRSSAVGKALGKVHA
jgi:hypothetical protein